MYDDVGELSANPLLQGHREPKPEPPFVGGAVEYESYDMFKEDSPRRLAQGWRIASVTDLPQRSGAARIATIGIGAVVWKPQPHVLVVYEREKVNVAPAVASTSATITEGAKKFCPECGSPTEGRKFCGDCGASTA